MRKQNNTPKYMIFIMVVTKPLVSKLLVVFLLVSQAVGESQPVFDTEQRVRCVPFARGTFTTV